MLAKKISEIDVSHFKIETGLRALIAIYYPKVIKL